VQAVRFWEAERDAPDRGGATSAIAVIWDATAGTAAVSGVETAQQPHAAEPVAGQHPEAPGEPVPQARTMDAACTTVSNATAANAANFGRPGARGMAAIRYESDMRSRRYLIVFYVDRFALQRGFSDFRIVVATGDPVSLCPPGRTGQGMTPCVPMEKPAWQDCLPMPGSVEA
jgi:hypothetical protein